MAAVNTINYELCRTFLPIGSDYSGATPGGRSEEALAVLKREV